MRCMPARLCEFPSKEQVLTVVYGFGEEPMLLLSNLNLFAMLAVENISFTTAIHKDNVFPAELKECSKRIYEMPQFIFYAIGYALERVLSSISGFLPPKVRSQQITLFEYFKISDCGT